MFGPLTIPTTSLESARANIQRYAQLRKEAGFGPAPTKLAVWTYVSEDADEAADVARRYMSQYSDSALRHYELLSDHLKNIRGYEAYAAQSEALRQDSSVFTDQFSQSHPWGTPEQAIEKTKELAHAFGTDEMMFVFRYGDMPMEIAERSMRLFADKVLPELKEIQTQPISAP